jgi:hypothetical protein
MRLTGTEGDYALSVLFDRLKAVFGISYQFAVSPGITKIPVLTPVYDHAWLLTMRMPF